MAIGIQYLYMYLHFTACLRTRHVGAEARRKLEPLDPQPVRQAVLALARRADVAGRVRAAPHLRHSAHPALGSQPRQPYCGIWGIGGIPL